MCDDHEDFGIMNSNSIVQDYNRRILSDRLERIYSECANYSDPCDIRFKQKKALTDALWLIANCFYYQDKIPPRKAIRMIKQLIAVFDTDNKDEYLQDSIYRHWENQETFREEDF